MGVGRPLLWASCRCLVRLRWPGASADAASRGRRLRWADIHELVGSVISAAPPQAIFRYWEMDFFSCPPDGGAI